MLGLGAALVLPSCAVLVLAVAAFVISFALLVLEEVFGHLLAE